MPLVELNLEACRVLAAAHGLPLGFVIKEVRVFDALVELAAFNAGEGGRELIFKGGTALNKIHFVEVQRFSEDLDFDLATIHELGEVKKFFERVSRLMEEAGFKPDRIRRIGRREPSLQLELSFDSPLGQKDFVRLDFAVKPAIATEDVVENVVARSSFVERAVAGVRAYSFDGLVARKIAAIAGRCEGRDVYDVVHGLPKATKEFPSVIKRMLACEKSSLSVKEFLSKAAENLRKANFVELRNLTNPYIPLALRPPSSGAWRDMAVTLAGDLEKIAERA